MLEEMILNSEACFKEILDYVQEEMNEQPIDEVEKELFSKLLALGQGLMRVFITKQDRGYAGMYCLFRSGTNRPFNYVRVCP